MPTNQSPPIGYVKFRIPYSAIDVFIDPADGKPRNGDALDETARKALKRDAKLSQARYDAWLEDLQKRVSKAMPSFHAVDERPSPGEHVVLASKMFRISIIADNWYFTVKLATDPDCPNLGLQAANFARSCRRLRDVLLAGEMSGQVLVKRSQTSFVKLSGLSDADLDAMSFAARIRIVPAPSPTKSPVKGYNEPAKTRKKNDNGKDDDA